MSKTQKLHFQQSSITTFDKLKTTHSNDCQQCYSTNTPCHTGISDFNCFFCSCPHYTAEKDSGGCSIDCRKGKFIGPYPASASGKIWDCSDCTILHSRESVTRYLTTHFSEIRQEYETFQRQ